jgi:periplasmic divalent cation tolerance protein
MSEIEFIYVTCRDKLEARELGKSLLEEKLAACINIFPSIESIYPWKNKIEFSEEAVLIVKTKKSYFEKVKVFLEKKHSYTIPCILSIPISQGNESYTNWLLGNLNEN